MDLDNMALDQSSRPSSPQKKSQQRHGAWSLTEDAHLRAAYAKYGNRWVTVAAEVGTRSSDQCAKRWCENLNPELDHGPWTSEEEEYLLQLVQVHGHNWRFMADHYLESRAPLALKNRYMLLMRRAKRQDNAQQYVANAAAAASAATGTTATTTATTANSGTTLSAVLADQQRQARRAAAIPLPRSRNASPFFENSNLADYISATTDQLHSQNWSSTQTLPDASLQQQNSMTDLNQNMFNQGTWAEPNSSANSHRATISQLTTPTTPPISTTWDESSMLWQNSPWSSDFDLSRHLNEPAMSIINQPRPTSAPMMTPTSSMAGHSQRNEDMGLTMSARPRNQDGTPLAVEYSVTCQASKLKATVSRLVDATISNIEGGMADDDQVTVVLKLKAR